MLPVPTSKLLSSTPCQACQPVSESHVWHGKVPLRAANRSGPGPWVDHHTVISLLPPLPPFSKYGVLRTEDLRPGNESEYAAPADFCEVYRVRSCGETAHADCLIPTTHSTPRRCDSLYHSNPLLDCWRRYFVFRTTCSDTTLRCHGPWVAFDGYSGIANQ